MESRELTALREEIGTSLADLTAEVKDLRLTLHTIAVLLSAACPMTSYQLIENGNFADVAHAIRTIRSEKGG